MWLEVILVIAVLPLVAVGLALAWSNRLGEPHSPEDVFDS